MKVLFLSQIVPYPPDSGPKVKTYNVLRYLAEHGHHITLACFVRSEEKDSLRELNRYCEIHTVPMRRSRHADLFALAACLGSARPFLVTRDAKPEMRALVHRLAQEQHFDIVHADQLTMGQFALEGNGAHRVFDAHNAVWTIVSRARSWAPLLARPLLAHEANRLKTYEGNLCRQMDAVLAVSEVDRQALVDAGADATKIRIIPIAVDCTRLQPVPRVNDSSNILTVSTLFYPPNADGVRWFMRQVYPLIRQKVPDATLTIVGPRPPRAIVQLAAHNAPHVQVTGYVADLKPYLESARVMVVPVRAGSGMRVRILEALALGIPVITTTTGAEGIDAVNGEHLLVADEPLEFAGAVARVLRDVEMGQRLSCNGRILAQRRYDWEVVLPKVEAVYASLGPKIGQRDFGAV